jgi:hypothetical protein
VLSIQASAARSNFPPCQFQQTQGASNTSGAGFAFMIGGILLANAKISTCMIVEILGGRA